MLVLLRWPDDPVPSIYDVIAVEFFTSDDVNSSGLAIHLFQADGAVFLVTGIDLSSYLDVLHTLRIGGVADLSHWFVSSDH